MFPLSLYNDWFVSIGVVVMKSFTKNKLSLIIIYPTKTSATTNGRFNKINGVKASLDPNKWQPHIVHRCWKCPWCQPFVPLGDGLNITLQENIGMFINIKNARVNTARKPSSHCSSSKGFPSNHQSHTTWFQWFLKQKSSLWVRQFFKLWFNQITVPGGLFQPRCPILKPHQ